MIGPTGETEVPGTSREDEDGGIEDLAAVGIAKTPEVTYAAGAEADLSDALLTASLPSTARWKTPAPSLTFAVEGITAVGQVPAPQSDFRTCFRFQESAMPKPEELSPSPVPVADPLRLDPITCDGCGRTFMAADGRKLIAQIKGSCPDCGGRFRLDV